MDGEVKMISSNLFINPYGLLTSIDSRYSKVNAKKIFGKFQKNSQYNKDVISTKRI